MNRSAHRRWLRRRPGVSGRAAGPLHACDLGERKPWGEDPRCTLNLTHRACREQVGPHPLGIPILMLIHTRLYSKPEDDLSNPWPHAMGAAIVLSCVESL